MENLRYIIVGTFFLFCSSCGEELQEEILINSDLVGTWNASSVTGGFAGIQCEYQPGELVITFDSADNLNVINNVMNTTAVCGGQEIGTSIGNHKYGVLESNNKKYLLIDNIESGEIIVTSTMLTIDQNNSSQGSGADLYMLTFVKEN